MPGGQLDKKLEKTADSVAASLVAGVINGANALGLKIPHTGLKGLESASKVSATSRINFAAFAVCLRDIADTARDDSIGVQLGTQLAVSNFNALGYAAASCENLNDALQLIPQYESLIMTQGNTLIRQENQRVEVSWTMSGEQYLSMLEDLFLASWVTLAHMLSGQNTLGIKASFTHKEPQNLMLWQKTFGPDLYFNQPKAAISFDVVLLELPILHSDPFMFQVMTKEADGLASTLGLSLRSKVADWLIQQLPKGEPDQASLAQYLNISERTLRRRLQQESTGFKEILESVRKAKATYYLRNTIMPIIEISMRLGYQQLTTFNAAYKRWTGQTPGAVRSINDN